MIKQEKMLAKKRGRPATGRGQTIGVRCHEPLIDAVDRFISEEAPGITRPEAIRRLATEQLQGLGIMPLPGRTDEER